MLQQRCTIGCCAAPCCSVAPCFVKQVRAAYNDSFLSLQGAPLGLARRSNPAYAAATAVCRALHCSRIPKDEPCGRTANGRPLAPGVESIVDRSIVIHDTNNVPLACASIVYADDYGCVQVCRPSTLRRGTVSSAMRSALQSARGAAAGVQKCSEAAKCVAFALADELGARNLGGCSESAVSTATPPSGTQSQCIVSTAHWRHAALTLR